MHFIIRGAILSYVNFSKRKESVKVSKKKSMGAQQFASLAFHFTTGSSVLIIPSILASASRQNAWLSAILSFLIGLLLVALYSAVGSMYPRMNLAEYSEHIFGTWIGKAVSLSFVIFFLLLAALVLRNVGDFITTEMMPETPLEAIHVLMLLIVVMAVRLHLDVIGRAAEIFFFAVTFIFFLTTSLILPEAQVENIQPIFGEGIKPIIRGSISFVGTPFLELVVFLMLFPYVNHAKSAKKGFFIGTALAGFWLILSVLVSVLSLSATITELTIYPTYYVVKRINVADFIQRVESTLAVLWFISIFFKITLCFYAALLALTEILNLKEHRSLTVPLALIIFVLSIIAYPNVAYYQQFTTTIWPLYTATMGLIIPLMLLGVGAFRKRNGKEAPKQRHYIRR